VASWIQPTRKHARPIAWCTAALVVALGACPTSTSTTSTTGMPDNQSCPITGTGLITGSPSMEMGRGSREFIAAADGDTWTAANGPQGGSHLWLSLRTTGLGPDIRLEYVFEELDGGILANTPGTATVCASSVSPTGQERIGITAFLPDEDAVRQRLLCQGPFNLRVRVQDESDRLAQGVRLIGGVTPDMDSFIPFRLRCDAGVPDDGGG